MLADRVERSLSFWGIDDLVSVESATRYGSTTVPGYLNAHCRLKDGASVPALCQVLRRPASYVFDRDSRGCQVSKGDFGIWIELIDDRQLLVTMSDTPYGEK